MSAEDNPPADQSDVGEALVAALGFEPTEGRKRGGRSSSSSSTTTSSNRGKGKDSSGESKRSPTSNGPAKIDETKSKTESKSDKTKTETKSGSGPERGGGRSDKSTNGKSGSETKSASDTDPTDTKAKSGSKGSTKGRPVRDSKVEVDEDLFKLNKKTDTEAGSNGRSGNGTSANDIKSAAKPAVSERPTIVVGGDGDDDGDAGWVSVSAKSSPDPEPPNAPVDEPLVESKPPVDSKTDKKTEGKTNKKTDEKSDKKTDRDTTVDPLTEDETTVADGAFDDLSDLMVSPGEAEIDEPPMAAAAAATGELAARAEPAADGINGVSSVVQSPIAVPTGPVTPGAEAPTAPPGLAPTQPIDEVGLRSLETRDDEIQSARLEAEARARLAGQEVQREVGWTNPFRRTRRLQSRKVRRVVRHIDPWSVLTFSVLFHLCVFAALLLASVLVWNAAEASGTIENVETFILDLGDYETFEINGDAVFRAAVAIAGILTLASSVLLVLLTVVFNLISDLVGGIRLTVIEEETVRVRRRKTPAE